MNVLHIGAGEVAEIQERIALGAADLCVVFPSGFDDAVAAYDAQTSAGPAPNIEIYFNSTIPNSHSAFRVMVAILDDYEASLANKFDINRGILDADKATIEDISATLIASMLPMLLLLFLFSGCMGLAPESIAGEKERGTLATLLVTPLGRSELAAGKILSLAALSFLSGLVTALATILSLPRLFGGAEDMVITQIYGARDYVLLALVILSTILLIVAVISIVSAFARTVKEANMAVAPLMIVVMVVGVTGMFGSAQESAVYYLIPLYNSVQSMSGVFSLEYSTANIALSSLSNFIYACIGGFVLTKMFNSEKIMFSR
jgi:sodium transport system permease protein